MCGIFGMYVKDRNSADVQREEVERLTRFMNHRGPDDEGFYVSDGIGLGHKRLSIIDLSGGRQPIFNENGDRCIVFNGEIYNYRSLREDLQGKGHNFRTNSDTEVILHAYEEYGPECLKLFRGIFAFAIYDLKNRELFIARDHIGVKPLYYYQDERVFLFASEIKPILNSRYVKAGLNRLMIDSYLSLGYVPGENTLFDGIRKIPPAMYGLVNKDGMKLGQYWKLEEPRECSIGSNPAKYFLDLFYNIVEMQLVSEVPLGVFLSGGLDSSAVVAAMKEVSNNDIHTFSVGFPGNDNISELKYARKVSDAFCTQHHEYFLTFGDFFESIRSLVYYAEEPIVEGAAIALLQLSRLAKKEATVMLSGEGADELFAGYSMYSRIKPRIDQLHRIIGLFPDRLCNKIISTLPFSEKFEKYFDWGHRPLEEWYRTVSSDVNPGLRRKMYTKDFLSFSDETLDKYFCKVFDKVSGRSDLFRMLYVDTLCWLPDDLLLKADKMTMAASIELRVPFLDPRMVEFAATLPDSWKIRNGEGKYILKTAMEGLLPREIIYRRKRGFPLPIRDWFKDQLYGKVAEVILSDSLLSRDIFSVDYLKWILESHRSGREDHSRRILSIIILEYWIREYLT
jgi:asparagine synthase (glutamine-hydrolysing)